MRRLVCFFFLLSLMGFAQNPMSSNFPSSLDTDTTLAVACNSARTTLTVAVTNATTALTFQVADSSKFCAPSYIDIEGEMIKICSKATGVLTGCTGGRAIHGGIANHAINAPVVVRPDENYHNGLQAAIKAIQAALQVNLNGVLTPTRNLLFGADGTYDIGDNAGTGRPRDGRFTRDLYAATGNFGDWKISSILTSASTTITLDAVTHNGTTLVTTSSSPITITVPIGLGSFSVLVVQGGTGIITFAQGSGNSLFNPDSTFKSKGQGALTTVTCWGTNKCSLGGNLQQ